MSRTWCSMRVVIAAALVVAGCDGAATDSRDDYIVGDSAGIRIVDVSGPEPGDAEIARELVEEVRIGVLDGDERYQFDRIHDVAVDTAGRIYVANNGSLTIRVYDDDGVFLHEMGGRGGGPGEFARMINDIWVESDTVFGVDWQGATRVNAYTADGAPIASWTPRAGQAGPLPLAGNRREWLGRDYGRLADQGDGPVFDVPLVRVDAEAGATIDTILRLPRRPLYRGASGEAGWDWPLFTVVAGSVVTPDRVIIHGGYPYEYRVADRTGRVLMIVRRAWRSVPVDEAMIQRYRELQAAFYDSLVAIGREGARQEHERAKERTERQLALPRPDTVPPLGRMVSGHDNAVWIERRDLGDFAEDEFNAMYGGFDDAPAGRSRWDVFDRDGRFLGRVELPDGFEPFVATTSTITGVLKDELDVEYVVRYRVPSRGLSEAERRDGAVALVVVGGRRGFHRSCVLSRAKATRELRAADHQRRTAVCDRASQPRR